MASISLDATLIDNTPVEYDSSSGRGPRMALVEGSAPCLSTETRLALAGRLRSAALVLFFGFSLFVAWQLINPTLRLHYSPHVFWFELVVTGVLGAASTLLCVRCPVTLNRLRWAEVAIFGLPAAFFVVMQYDAFAISARETNAIDCMILMEGLPIYWYGLACTYALFIPSTWRRAAAIVGAMAAAPIVLALVAAWRHEVVADALSPDQWIKLVLVMVIGAVVPITGVHVISRLRREAFEARQLGQYRLSRLLGSGGMGEVYLGEHQLLKRPCAIKVIHPEKAGDPHALARFEREVRAAARLSHWNTIEIFDYGRTADGTFYYVMEYLPGMSVADLVERYGPMPPARVVHLLKQTCQGLREAHQAGLVHRDIKPGNIFAAQRGGVYDVAKLLDFGLVKPLENGEDIRLTQEGAITGSPLFMSPEQSVGHDEPDARSDIYSLGAVAYFMLTGRPPFIGAKPLQVMFAHAHEEVSPPSQWRAELPGDLEMIVLRCLSKKPEDRYQDAESLRRALADCSAAGMWSDDRAAAWWRDAERPSAADRSTAAPALA